MMRGVGGPLLCIGDLLNDVGEDHHSHNDTTLQSSMDSPLSPPSPLSSSFSPPNLHPDHLTTLFQENYDQLKEALEGTDHSWTSLTLKLLDAKELRIQHQRKRAMELLCTALDTADKLVHLTNSHVGSLTNKIQELERVVKRGDSAVAEAKSIFTTSNSIQVSVEKTPISGSDRMQG